MAVTGIRFPGGLCGRYFWSADFVAAAAFSMV
jgi:hypothetical protein